MSDHFNPSKASSHLAEHQLGVLLRERGHHAQHLAMDLLGRGDVVVHRAPGLFPELNQLIFVLQGRMKVHASSV